MRKTSRTLFILAAVLLLSTTTLASETQTFTDVPSDSPYYDAVEYMHEHGIVNGCGDGRFCPDNKITIEQFWTIYLRFYFPEECATMLPNDTSVPYTTLAQTLELIAALPEKWNAKYSIYAEEYMWRFVYDAENIAPYPKWVYTNETPAYDQNTDVHYAAYLMGLADDIEKANRSATRGELVTMMYRIATGDYTPLPEVTTDIWKGIRVEENPVCWRERNAALYELTLLPEKYIEAFREKGWKLRFCENLNTEYADIANRLADRGSHFSGFYIPDRKIIVIGCESMYSPSNTFLHEFGHFVSDLATSTSYIQNIYKAEANAIAELVGRDYPKTHRTEAFAEAFRYIVRYRGDEDKYAKMQELIPLTLAYIERAFLNANGCFDSAAANAVTREYRDYINGATNRISHSSSPYGGLLFLYMSAAF